MADRYRCASDVAWVDGTELGDPEPVAWVTRVPDGSPVALEGTAWLVWVTIAEFPEGATARVIVEQVRHLHGPAGPGEAPEGGVTPGAEARAVHGFLEQLAEAGLVDRV
jgi:hypothetical protein